MTVMENELASTKAVRTQVGTSAMSSTTQEGDGMSWYHNLALPRMVYQSYLLPVLDNRMQLRQEVRTIIPSLSVLQSNARIQHQVDQRLRQLTELNESGKLKSHEEVEMKQFSLKNK